MAVTNLTQAQYDLALSKASPEQKAKILASKANGQLVIGATPYVAAPKTTTTVAAPKATTVVPSSQTMLSDDQVNQLYTKFSSDPNKLYSDPTFKKLSILNQSKVQNMFKSNATPTNAQTITPPKATNPISNIQAPVSKDIGNTDMIDKANKVGSQLGATDKAYTDYAAYANAYIGDKTDEYNKKYSALESMYNQQNTDFKNKYADLQSKIDANEKQLNDDFAKIRSSAEDYKSTQDKVVANRLAGQKAGLANQLGAAGASQSLVNDAFAKEEQQALADVNAVQKQYLDSLNNTATQYQSLARNILSDSTGLTESERLLADQYITRSKELLADKETFLNDTRNFAFKPYFDKVQGQLESTQTIEKATATTEAENNAYAAANNANKKMQLLTKLKIPDMITAGTIKGDQINKVLDYAIASGVSMAGAIAKLTDYLASQNVTTSTGSGTSGIDAANKTINKTPTNNLNKEVTPEEKAKQNQSIIDKVKQQKTDELGIKIKRIDGIKENDAFKKAPNGTVVEDNITDPAFPGKKMYIYKGKDGNPIYGEMGDGYDDKTSEKTSQNILPEAVLAKKYTQPAINLAKSSFNKITQAFTKPVLSAAEESKASEYMLKANASLQKGIDGLKSWAISNGVGDEKVVNEVIQSAIKESKFTTMFPKISGAAKVGSAAISKLAWPITIGLAANNATEAIKNGEFKKTGNYANDLKRALIFMIDDIAGGLLPNELWAPTNTQKIAPVTETSNQINSLMNQSNQSSSYGAGSTL